VRLWASGLETFPARFVVVGSGRDGWWCLVFGGLGSVWGGVLGLVTTLFFASSLLGRVLPNCPRLCFRRAVFGPARA